MQQSTWTFGEVLSHKLRGNGPAPPLSGETVARVLCLVEYATLSVDDLLGRPLSTDELDAAERWFADAPQRAAERRAREVEIDLGAGNCVRFDPAEQRRGVGSYHLVENEAGRLCYRPDAWEEPVEPETRADELSARAESEIDRWLTFHAMRPAQSVFAIRTPRGLPVRRFAAGRPRRRRTRATRGSPARPDDPEPPLPDLSPPLSGGRRRRPLAPDLRWRDADRSRIYSEVASRSAWGRSGTAAMHEKHSTQSDRLGPLGKRAA